MRNFNAFFRRWKDANSFSKEGRKLQVGCGREPRSLAEPGKSSVLHSINQHETMGSELLSRKQGPGISPYIERVVRSLAPFSASCNLVTIKIVQGLVETTLKRYVERK